jgi:hypothetical protein
MLDSHNNGYRPIGVIFCAFFTFAAMACAGTYSGGTGTVGKPYKIQRVSDWQELTNTPADWDKQFILRGGFGFGGTTITPVGNETTPFTGVMVGDGHAISGFKINQPDSDYVSLFGYIGSTGYIENLGVVSANIKGRNYVGGLVGKNSGVIFFCHTGNTISGTDFVGGMVGQNFTGTITACYATNNTVTGNGNFTGGLIGENYYGSITSSYAAVRVAGNGSFAGGLVGKNDAGTITACYSIGRVNGSDSVGGFCGFNTGTVSGCFWDTQISGTTTSDGGTGKTTPEMKTMDTFTAEGWVFSTMEASPTSWILLQNRYPLLSWQKLYSSGTGAEYEPFEIWTVDDWQVLMVDSFHWNCHFTLMTDLDFAGAAIKPVAPDTDPETWFDGIPFSGVFDGAGHTLSNFIIDEPTSDYVGLFGYVYGGLVKNLGVVNAEITGNNFVGGLVGCLYPGIITSCYSTSTVKGNGAIGGLVGFNDSEGTITSCYAAGIISGSFGVGGLVGENRGMITSCHATGTVMAGQEGNCIGGLVGTNSGGIINFCYATGAVSGNWEVGGLIGECNGEIVSCYAKGVVSGNGCVGGFAGLNQGGNIISCYSVGQVSGNSYAGGLCGGDTSVISNSFWDTQTSGQTTSSGGTGKTTAEMKMLTTYTRGGWDFTHEWIMPCEDYPHLLWEKTTYSGGSGTAADPYRIGCVADWQFLTTRPEDWSKQFIVTADLDFGWRRPCSEKLQD